MGNSNRILKFRAWDKIEKSMSDVFSINELAENTYPMEYSLMNYDIMQFTGLLDKPGKEIYEGDIVTGNLFFNGGTLPTMGQIKWDDGFAAFCLLNLGGNTLLHNHDRTSFKIIGNIYENPELLEEP